MISTHDTTEKKGFQQRWLTVNDIKACKQSKSCVLAWVIKVQISRNQDLHQETMHQDIWNHKSFGIFEIHHLKIPYSLIQDLDCSYI